MHTQDIKCSTSTLLNHVFFPFRMASDFFFNLVQGLYIQEHQAFNSCIPPPPFAVVIMVSLGFQ